MTKLKAGVIGLGMGWGHLSHYMDNPNVEVVAIADRREDRREKAKGAYPGAFKIYNEGIDMIRSEKLDLLSVAVPNNQHKDLTIAGLEAGAHVLCEKPMAMNAKEAQEMLDTSRKVGKKLGIDFSYRFNPQSRAMKEMVDSGELGNIYYGRSVWFRRCGIPGTSAANFNTGSSAMGSWFFDKKQSGGGPLIDLGVHRLDLALWLMGYPKPAWIMSSTYNKRGVEYCKKLGLDFTVDDMACAMIKFHNGATLELDVSWITHIKEGEKQSTRLIGDKGGLFQFNLNEGYTYDLEYYFEMGKKQFDSRLHYFPPTPSAFDMFVDSIVNDKEFLVKPEEPVTVMKILDAIYKSAESNAPVEF